MILEPRELQAIQDAKAVEAEVPGRLLAEVEDRWDELRLAVEDHVEGFAERSIADKLIYGPLWIELGVSPVHDPPMRDVDEVVPWVRCGAGRSLVGNKDDHGRGRLGKGYKLQRSDPAHVPHSAAGHVDPSQELIGRIAHGPCVAEVVTKTVSPWPQLDHRLILLGSRRHG